MEMIGVLDNLSVEINEQARIVLHPGERLDVEIGGATLVLWGGVPSLPGQGAFVQLTSEIGYEIIGQATNSLCRFSVVTHALARGPYDEHPDPAGNRND